MTSVATLASHAKTETLGHWLRISAHCAPKLASKWATNLFLKTRGGDSNGSAGVPLGASVIPLSGRSGVNQAFVWSKSGPLVFLVHGWGGDSGAMCTLACALRERGLRPVAFDAPGHGAASGHHTTMTQFVAAVREVLNTVEPTADVHAVVGHSLGGLAAIAALSSSMRLPNRVVLLSTPSCVHLVLHQFMSLWRLPTKIEAGMLNELRRRHGVPMQHWDLRTLGPRDQFEVLVLHDRDDTYVPWQQARIVADALGPKTKTVVTEGLGHARILVDPAVVSLVGDFVASMSEEARGKPYAECT